MCKILFDKGRMKYQNVNKLDKKTQHARVYFTPACIHFPHHACSLLSGKEMIFMEFEFDELTELEIMDLLDQKNYLLNILESGCSLERESEILDKLNHIQEQLDILY